MYGICNLFIPLWWCAVDPCIRLARLKFKLTNQDSANGKNFTVLQMSLHYVNRNSIEIRQLFSLKMALNIARKGIYNSKNISDCKRRKIWNIFCLQASNLVPKIGRWRPERQLARSSSSVARWDNSCVILNNLVLFLVILSPEFSS